MKKILTILMAVIILAIMCWFVAYHIKAPAIEADIKQRVEQALTINDLKGVTASVDGRDVMLSGIVSSQKSHQQLLVIGDIDGVNRLSDNTLLQSQSMMAANAEVLVTKPSTKSAPAYPYSMSIVRDEAGKFALTGVVPDAAFKVDIDHHLAQVGADPSQTRWNVNVSSATPPAGWTQHSKNGISALQALRQGEVSFADKKAVVKGTAISQAASDKAESFAQLLAEDYTTDVILNIAEKTIVIEKRASLVGSTKYAALSCQVEFNRLLKLDKIQFENGASLLQQSNTDLFNKIVKAASYCHDQVIFINGYTDSNGSAKANQALSQQRAEAVMNQLVSLGLNPARLMAEGYGEVMPVASNETEEGRAKNRRIELIIKGLN